MSTASVIGSFVRRPRPENRGLILEQAPRKKGVGRVSRLQIILAAAARLYGLEPPEIDCGVDGNGFRTAVYAYPYDPDLAYRFGVTHGFLSGPIREEVVMRELVSFSLTSEAKLEYPLRELVSIDLPTEVWSEEGAVIPGPQLSVVDGETVRSARPIYGTAEVIYKTLRDTHGLQIAAREDAVGNVYQSAFWAAWDGGNKLLPIEAPDGAEEDYELGIECTGGTTLDIPPDEDTPPAPSLDRTITLDYCEDFK